MLKLSAYGIEPKATFECGQCFRWIEEDGGYVGVADSYVGVVKDGILYCEKEEEVFWKEYFCLDTDYGSMQEVLKKNDGKLKKCIAYGKGIRLLKQNIWETVISFIISANNNIPRIQKIIDGLCRMFGDEILKDGKTYFSFPTPEIIAKLSPEDLSPLKMGYRDKYVLDAAERFASGEISGEKLLEMSTEDARKKLLEIKGIGKKVADCILLFGLGRYEVFPRDVWINRVMENIYNVTGGECDEFVKKSYGNLAGLAQQYLFYYYRDNFKVK